MNDLFGLLAIQAWKPVLTALVLPPVPWLVLIVWGAHRLARRRALGGMLIALGVAALWAGTTTVTVRAVVQALGLNPPPLALPLAASAADAQTVSPPTAIVVLGGGRDHSAPAYGAADLSPDSAERLRYGIWLARKTGLPLAYSGGTGWAGAAGAGEAEIAGRVARDTFGWPLRWTESLSRDTRENAQQVLPMLKRDGIERVLLVTHAWHMPRAMRAFGDAAGPGMSIVAAPMGQFDQGPMTVVDWLPSSDAHGRLRRAFREVLGWWLGA